MIASPCIGVCEYDAATGYCRGCGRSEAEIGGWRAGGETWRRAVWEELPGRLRALGVGLRRPAWTAEDIRAFVRETMASGGTWVLGCHGAVAEFVAGGCAVSDDGDAVVATAPGGALRLAIGETTRAIRVHDPEGDEVRAVVLALHRSRLALPVASGLTEIGPDHAAIDPARRGEILFDLGLGRTAIRFMIRAAESALAARLRGLAGAPLGEVLAAAGAAIVEAGPTRVVETGIGRAEIGTPIPPPGGRSPEGPHTHLLPDMLALGRDLPPGIDLPEAYAPAAVFHAAAGFGR